MPALSPPEIVGDITMTALVVLALTGSAIMALAAVGLWRIRDHLLRREVDPHCRQLERDIIMAIGMTMAVWTATAIALIINPDLGATALYPSGHYSIARGTIMLAFGHCVGWGGFLVRRATWWESHPKGE